MTHFIEKPVLLQWSGTKHAVLQRSNFTYLKHPQGDMVRVSSPGVEVGNKHQRYFEEYQPLNPRGMLVPLTEMAEPLDMGFQSNCEAMRYQGSSPQSVGNREQAILVSLFHVLNPSEFLFPMG